MAWHCATYPLCHTCFHSFQHSSICQRQRASTSASSIESNACGTLVIRMVQPRAAGVPCPSSYVCVAAYVCLLLPVACAHWAAAPLWPSPLSAIGVLASSLGLLGTHPPGDQPHRQPFVLAQKHLHIHLIARLRAQERHQIPALPALIDEQRPGVGGRQPVAARLAVRSHLC